jgi:hypothetical protein
MNSARASWSVLSVLTAAAVLAGCREKKEKEAPAGAVVFQISARHPTAADTAPSLAINDTMLVHGRDTLFLGVARVVLAGLAMAPSVSNECEEEVGEDNPPCVEFDEEPVVIELPLGAGVTRRSTKPAPATDYNLFQAMIHRPDSVSAHDVQLLLHHPELWARSIRVEGTISRGGRRRAFTFNSDFNETEEISLEPALTVKPGDSLHVTLRVDVASWFRSADGRSFVDPSTAGLAGRNEALVRDNIRQSLEVFRDANADGLEDGGSQ